MTGYVSYFERARDERRHESRLRRQQQGAAKFAADQYEMAAHFAKHARWLTRRPDLWDDEHGTPASWERLARTCEQSADSSLERFFALSEDAHAASARAYRYQKRHEQLVAGIES